MGSKRKLLGEIWNVASRFEFDTAVDLFSGSGIVGYMFKSHGKAVYTMFMTTKKHAFSYAIMAATLVLTAFLKIDAVFVIIGCAVFGLVWSLLFRKGNER